MFPRACMVGLMGIRIRHVSLSRLERWRRKSTARRSASGQDSRDPGRGKGTLLLAQSPGAHAMSRRPPGGWRHLNVDVADMHLTLRPSSPLALGTPAERRRHTTPPPPPPPPPRARVAVASTADGSARRPGHPRGVAETYVLYHHPNPSYVATTDPPRRRGRGRRASQRSPSCKSPEHDRRPAVPGAGGATRSTTSEQQAMHLSTPHPRRARTSHFAGRPGPWYFPPASASPGARRHRGAPCAGSAQVNRLTSTSWSRAGAPPPPLSGRGSSQVINGRAVFVETRHMIDGSLGRFGWSSGLRRPAGPGAFWSVISNFFDGSFGEAGRCCGCVPCARSSLAH